MIITEQEARQAPEFIVDWTEDGTTVSVSGTFTDYRAACRFAVKTARTFGTAYLMPLFDGNKAAQWMYSDTYPRHFGG